MPYIHPRRDSRIWQRFSDCVFWCLFIKVSCVDLLSVIVKFLIILTCYCCKTDHLTRSRVNLQIETSSLFVRAKVKCQWYLNLRCIWELLTQTAFHVGMLLYIYNCRPDYFDYLSKAGSIYWLSIMMLTEV